MKYSHGSDIDGSSIIALHSNIITIDDEIICRDYSRWEKEVAKLQKYWKFGRHSVPPWGLNERSFIAWRSKICRRKFYKMSHFIFILNNYSHFHFLARGQIHQNKIHSRCSTLDWFKRTIAFYLFFFKYAEVISTPLYIRKFFRWWQEIPGKKTFFFPFMRVCLRILSISGQAFTKSLKQTMPG